MAGMTDLLLWIEGLAPLRAIRTSTLLWPAVSAAHIAGFGVMLGAIAAYDLAVLRRGPVAVLGPWLVPLAGWALAVALATGLILFGTRASLYAQNAAMLAKLGLIAAGLLNIAAFRWRPSRGLAALSLVIWSAVLVAGRWTAFI
jgi:hypothetical protein